MFGSNQRPVCHTHMHTKKFLGEVLERRREANFGINTFNSGRRILRLRGLRPKAWRELGMSSWWHLLLNLLLRAFIYWLSKPEHLFCAKLPMAFGDRDKYIRRLFTWPHSLQTIKVTTLRKGKEDNQTSLETGQRRFPRREHSSWALKHHHSGGREGREIHCMQKPRGLGSQSENWEIVRLAWLEERLWQERWQEAGHKSLEWQEWGVVWS